MHQTTTVTHTTLSELGSRSGVKGLACSSRSEFDGSQTRESHGEHLTKENSPASSFHFYFRCSSGRVDVFRNVSHMRRADEGTRGELNTCAIAVLKELHGAMSGAYRVFSSKWMEFDKWIALG